MSKLSVENSLDEERKSLRNKHMDGVIDEEEFRLGLISLGERYLEIGSFFVAIYIFSDIHSCQKLRQVGDMALQAKDGMAALMAFSKLDDQPKLIKAVKLLCLDRDEGFEYWLVDFAMSKFVEEALYESFRDFYLSYGFTKGNVVAFEFSQVFQAAYNLGSKYDLIIGNAKGGLCSAYAFYLLGFKTKLCETHRKGRGATFKWLDSVKETDFAGKNILLLDKDIVSGRSLRRIVRELSIYPYAKLDVFFNWGSSHSRLRNVPSEINEAFYPEKLDYGNFYEVLEILASKVRAS